MVRNLRLFKSTLKPKDPFWSTKKNSALQTSLNAKASWGEVTRGQQKSGVKCHTAFNHSSFQIVWSGHLLEPFHLSFYASLCSFFKILFLCNVAGHSVLNFLVTQWGKCPIWYEATCQHLLSGLICSLFPFLFSDSAGSPSVNSNNHTTVRCGSAFFFYGCQNPGSDECPWGSAYHLRSVSLWMFNFLFNWTCS